MQPAAAQQSGTDDYSAIEEVITTGTRARERSVTESPAPIDVVSGEDFLNQADTDLSTLLRNVVPSYNVGTQPISDASTIVRPANLRGLAPDHTLVLINGKRRHRAAVIYWLGNGVANGAQGPDISLIPAIALKQVEILRDGASSQYGSDAIAGVMNFILKDDTEGATFDVKYGQYAEGDGESLTFAGNIGLPFSSNGFANLSFEYGNSDPTDRSVQRSDALALIAAGNTAVATPAQIWGSPEIKDDYKIWANIGLDLGNGKEFYSHGNLAGKHVDGGFFFRNPNTRSAVFSGDGGASLLIGDLLMAGMVTEDDGLGPCPAVPVVNNVPAAGPLQEVFDREQCFSFQEIFPGGFTPRFGGDVSDAALTGGVRGETENGLRWDVSASAGRNEVEFFIRNTVNASLGPNTPTTFDPGAYTQFEKAVNFDFGFAPTPTTNLAFGAEYRKEEFEITVGQEESFIIGPLADQGFSAASNGFPGFSNIAGGEFQRENVGLYVDGEWEATDRLLFGAAVRWEDFQDFGTTTNGKIAVNWRITDQFGIRGTLGTGFKAPTPGQSNAFNVSTEFDQQLMELVNNGTIPATTDVAMAVGGKALEPEESTNGTLGVFFNVASLDVTIDYFKIDVDDRLNLSQNFDVNSQDVIDALEAAGITSAGNLQNFRFFTNDFDTETEGVDIVATYPIDWGNSANTDLSLAYNHTNTRVTDSGVTVDAARIAQLEAGLPETRWNVSANSFFNNWRVLGRVSYYDSWWDSEDAFVYGDAYIVDAEAAYRFNDAMAITVGAHNLFDEFPDENPSGPAVGNRYSQYSPFGFNGAMWYLRLTYDMN